MSKILVKNKTETVEKTRTALSELIEEAMDAKGMGIRELAIAAGITYEHARRVVRGENIPSNPLLKVFSGILGLDEKLIERTATHDRLNIKFGGIPMELSGKDPSLAPMERLWPKLSQEQHKNLLSIATSWAKMNAQQNKKEHEEVSV